MPAALAAPSLSAHLASAIGLLCQGLTASLPGNLGKAAVILAAWSRLRRLLARFAALVAAVEAGRISVRRRTTAGRRRPRPATPLATPPVRLPGGSGWLLRLAPVLDTRIGRSQVESLLGAPEFGALLAQAPQAGRILRPLCHMLGIETPAALRLPVRRRRPPSGSGATDAGAASGDATPARPAPPFSLTPPRSPPLPEAKTAPASMPPDPTRTGPPRT